MGMRERAWMRAAGHQAGEMRHVHHQLGADAVGDLAEAAEIDDARIGRAAGDDHLRAMLARELGHLVHVDAMVVAAHAVGHRLEPLARHVDRRAVAEMAAGGEVEAEERVAGLHQREERRDIGGCAGMRLHIGKARAEQFLDALDRQRFGDVDELAAAVIAPARQPFGIFVGQHRALRLQHGAADDVFRRDQLDLVALAAEFKPDRLGDLGIGFGKRGGKEESAMVFAAVSGADISGISRRYLPSIMAKNRQAWRLG